MAKLATYRAKRDFTKTSEPKGASPRRSGVSFVVQKHDASRLHYDFRLELDGVLKSWAVARGPSLVPDEKRLAVEVEDHPVAYGDFEGTIPAGQYGGGTVMVWDRGTWEPEGNPAEGLDKGRLTFKLDGEKLKGTWHLVRMRPRPREKQPSWLLIKSEDAYARTEDAADILEEAPLSVKTGRSLDDIAGKPAKAPAKRATVKKPAAKKNAPKAKKADSASLEIEGVTLTHPDKVLWNDVGVTKRQLAEFYVAIADRLLPHLVNRPLTMMRCPSGVEGKCFIQRHSWAGMSEAVRRRNVKDNGETEELVFVEDIKGVVALVQSGVLEMHVWGATIDDPDKADRLIFDLDPGEGIAWTDLIAGALDIRARLESLNLQSFIKVTGGKGLHIVVPLNPKPSWKDALAFSRNLAESLEAEKPDRYTTTSVKEERNGKIFIDYLRNNREASAVAPYSTRARAGAPVSVPVAWDDLNDVKPNGFTVQNLPQTLKTRRKDPWANFHTVRQALPNLKTAKS